jgi:hypothetical protein
VSVHNSKSASGASKAINWAIKICWLRSGPVLKYDYQDAENAPTDSRPFIKPVSQAVIPCTFGPNACVSCLSRVGLRVSFKAPDNLSMNIFYSAEKSSLLHHTPLFYCRSVPRAAAGGILFFGLAGSRRDGARYELTLCQASCKAAPIMTADYGPE